MGLIDYGKSLRVELGEIEDGNDKFKAVECMKTNISTTMALVMQRSAKTYNGSLDKQSNLCT